MDENPIVVPAELDCGDLRGDIANCQKISFKQLRDSLLKSFAQTKGFISCLKHLEDRNLYKVVYPGGQVLQQTKDGFYRGVVYGKKGIDAHVKFEKLGAQVFDAVKAVATQSLLVYVAVKVDRIEKQLDKVMEYIEADRESELRGSITTVEQYLRSENPENQSAIGPAINSINIGIHKCLDTLRTCLESTPEPYHNFWQALIGGNRITQAEEKMEKAFRQLALICGGIRALALCYSAKGEYNLSVDVVRNYFERIKEAGIERAIESARMLPFTDGKNPQEPWIAFLTQCDDFLRESELLRLPAKTACFELEFKPEEIRTFTQGENCGQMSSM